MTGDPNEAWLWHELMPTVKLMAGLVLSGFVFVWAARGAWRETHPAPKGSRGRR